MVGREVSHVDVIGTEGAGDDQKPGPLILQINNSSLLPPDCTHTERNSLYKEHIMWWIVLVFFYITRIFYLLDVEK